MPPTPPSLPSFHGTDNLFTFMLVALGLYVEPQEQNVFLSGGFSLSYGLVWF